VRTGSTGCLASSLTNKLILFYSINAFIQSFVYYQLISFQSKEDFKFHAAHFVAFEGYRERLHGHNYKVGVRLLGSRKIYQDGYVVDFGDIKRATRAVCKQLNEHFLCPMLSDVLTISETTTTTTDDNNHNHNIVILCQDGSQFVFPKEDCAMLPIVHATAEELAVYLWSRILEGLNASYLTERGIHTMEVIVAEAVGQEAVFRLEVPASNDDDGDAVVAQLDVAQFIRTGDIQPARPCPSALIAGSDYIPPNLTRPIHCQPQQQPTSAAATTPAFCKACQQSFSVQLQRIVAALNQNKASINLETITANDLQQLADNIDLKYQER
jgi:dihydroneopterin triphosphate aldolase (PTPS-III) / 6-pyruvoyltetrahydropterin synthase